MNKMLNKGGKALTMVDRVQYFVRNGYNATLHEVNNKSHARTGYMLTASSKTSNIFVFFTPNGEFIGGVTL